jgi:hypothetical protein
VQVTNAFMNGLHRGCFVATGVALVAAVLVLMPLLSVQSADAPQKVAHV